jgi:serine/threonine protein kinase
MEKYKILKQVGKGTFGIVYKGIQLDTNQPIAIKIEKDKHSRLELEYNIYNQFKNVIGVPRIIDFIKNEEKKEKTLIMEYLGPSLDFLFTLCKNKFTIKTAIMIAIQSINRLEQIHNQGFIHRDIKPDNFLVGYGQNKDIIYLVDFGLSKKYIDSHYRNDKNLVGSLRYASIRNHKGIEQSRRDDLESLGYMIIYFINGCLPWQNVQKKTEKEIIEEIFNIKRNISLKDLCNGLPEEFYLYMKYCRLLRFVETPDYKYLRKLMYAILFKNNWEYDFNYDWMNKI